MSERPTNGRHPMVELAVAVGDEKTLDGILGSLLLATREGESGGGNVHPESVAELSGEGITEELVHLVLSRLGEEGATARVDSEGKVVYRVENGRMIKLFDVARSVILAREHSFSSQPTGVEFVCTLPANDPTFELEDPVDFGFGQITSRLLALCGRARETLVVFGPFLEEGGIEWLLPGLEGALRSGVEVTVVSRELESEGKLSALDPLVEVAGSYEGDLAIYDYYDETEDLERPLYTLHSKLVIVDGDAAYVGSANFTTYGFDEYFEVGVIVEGDSVADLDDLCAYLVSNSAERVY